MIRCEEVLKHLYEYIDRQLEGVTYSEIEDHLKQCKYCCKHHDFEIELKNLVQRSCYQNKAPGVLKSKISSMLGDIQPE
ncbi:MAG: mycothiol system anti-sigma-R factor [candidate division Zixibacteria bacterium]|nr:mycothiol system anti-sigma-R factor [candidate division Zixibacteria bacterium]